MKNHVCLVPVAAMVVLLTWGNAVTTKLSPPVSMAFLYWSMALTMIFTGRPATTEFPAWTTPVTSEDEAEALAGVTVIVLGNEGTIEPSTKTVNLYACFLVPVKEMRTLPWPIKILT